MLDRLRREKLAVPAAMSFVVGGLAMIAFSFAIPHIATLNERFGRNWIDFVAGFLIGLGIALEIIGIATLVPALAAKRRKGPDSSR